MKSLNCLKWLVLVAVAVTVAIPGTGYAKKKKPITFLNNAGATYSMPIVLRDSRGNSCSTDVPITQGMTPAQKAEATKNAINNDCSPPFSATHASGSNKTDVSSSLGDMRKAKAYAYKQSHNSSISYLLPGDQMDGTISLYDTPSSGTVAVTALGHTAEVVTNGMPNADTVLAELSAQLSAQGVSNTLGPGYMEIPDLDISGLTLDMNDEVMIGAHTTELVVSAPSLTEYGLAGLVVLILISTVYLLLRRRRLARSAAS
jgi:hypothetical protein